MGMQPAFLVAGVPIVESPSSGNSSVSSTSAWVEDGDKNEFTSGRDGVAGEDFDGASGGRQGRPGGGHFESFRMERIFDKRKLKNDDPCEFEDIVWKLRYLLLLSLLILHGLPLFDLITNKHRNNKPVTPGEVILNGLLPLFVPLFMIVGFYSPLLLGICENHLNYELKFEHRLACGWCNGFLIAVLLLIVGIIALHVYPFLFLVGCVDLLLLWIVTYRMMTGGSKENKRSATRFQENAKRAKTRRTQSLHAEFTNRKGGGASVTPY